MELYTCTEYHGLSNYSTHLYWVVYLQCPVAHGAKLLLVSDKKILFSSQKFSTGQPRFHSFNLLGTLSLLLDHSLSIFSCINFPCYLILRPYLSKRHLHLRDFHNGYKNPVISKSLWVRDSIYKFNTNTSL